MPPPDTRIHLAALYAGADDPWNTHASHYERQKFAQTVASLPRHRLPARSGGGLRRRCADRASGGAMRHPCRHGLHRPSARRRGARTSCANVVFTEGAAPVTWPAQPPDLVMLSEVLYFMTNDESVGLASRLVQDCAPECDVVLVNWLGHTGGGIGGAAAAVRLIGMLAGTHHRLFACSSVQFEIDVLRRNARHGPTAG